MKSFNGSVQLRREMQGWWQDRNPLVRIVLATICLAMAHAALGQVEPAARANGVSLSAGDTVSFFHLQYGSRNLVGISAYADLDTKRHWGIEGEGRWLIFNRVAGVQDATYLGGPRYFMDFGSRFQIYAKGLVGVGKFTFVDNSAQGTYFVFAPGEGLDYKINRHFQWRIAEFEYQYWPGFPTGALSSAGVSSGIRYTIF